MRRSLPVNAALVAAAAMAALVLTAVRRSPEGLVTFQLAAPEVRAAPGEAQVLKHDLTALEVFNFTLLRIKDRYVEPSRIEPSKMFLGALDMVQFRIPEVLVEPDPANQRVVVAVNDKRETFGTDDVTSLWRLAAGLKRVFRFIQTNMNSGADLAQVEYAAVNGMLATLDPHSDLMDPEAAREMDVSTSGKFGGLGLEIRMIERKLTVTKPMPGTPAFRAGIKAGDHIVRIGTDATENLTSDEAVDRMRGEPKTPVTLYVARKEEPKELRFDLVRAVITVASVDYKLLDKHVGLLKVKQFQGTTAAEAAEAMDTLAAQGATAWVLDLRGNPGGLLDQSVDLVDLFVDRGAVVTTVSTRKREVHNAHRGGDTTSSLAVLVNRGSASASEITAGALKNLGRAIIIGSRTYGKGSVQELYDNDDDGSKLKLTVAEYLTPGDRSIQNIGIVPDIQLQWMVVPEKNTAPGDIVRLLPPSKLYGEQELDEHLVSTYAKDIDKPAYELPYLVGADKPKVTAAVKPVAPATPTAPAAKPTPTTTTDKPAAAGSAAAGSADTQEDGGMPADPNDPDAEEPLSADDKLGDDFETRLARDLVASAPNQQRDGLIAGAKALVAKTMADNQAALTTAFTGLGVDWAAPPNGAASGAAALQVTLDNGGMATAKGGDLVTVTATIRNTGTAPAYQAMARLQSDDELFRDRELPVGKIEPGQQKAFSAQVRIPKDTVNRVTHLTAEVKEARSAKATITGTEIAISALPPPVFAYAYHLIDDGNGDGLVQAVDKFRLALTLRNTGTGAATETTALIRNASGDGVTVGKSRFELGAVAPGETKQVEFPFELTRAFAGDELVLEVLMYDAILGTTASEKLHFPITRAVQPTKAPAGIEVRGKQVEVRSGASSAAPLVATVAKGAQFAALATVGPWIKIDLGAGKPGFVAASDVGKLGSAPSKAGASSQFWNSTPPAIAVRLHGLDAAGATYTLEGSITDETKVEDMYVIVSNPGAKIDGRKVLYISNRGGKDPRRLDFSKDIPLWPGSNQVVVVTRESAEVRAVEQFVVYRAP